MTMERLVDGGATWPDGGGFHLAERLFFTRIDGDSAAGVLIRKYDSDAEGAVPTFAITCTPEEWASVVSSMEPGGETAESWQAALKRQMRLPR